MCGSRRIICSLLLLSALEIGLGVSSIALGTAGLCRARPGYKPQQGDASPVWSGVCVRYAFHLFYSALAGSMGSFQIDLKHIFYLFTPILSLSLTNACKEGGKASLMVASLTFCLLFAVVFYLKNPIGISNFHWSGF